MDDPDEENMPANWVIVNSIDLAEEATTLDIKYPSDEDTEKNHGGLESDIDSDGISIISESSHLQESNNEEQTTDDEDLKTDISVLPNGCTDESSQLNKTELGSKPNWTFVASEPSPPEVSSNQFYLNCLQEPIHELSEHELGSAQSDLDSDGISIISECESLNEYQDEKVLSQETLVKENCDNEKIEITSRLPPSIRKYCNGVLIGTVLLATTSIFLGQYFSSVEPLEEDLPIYKEFSSEVTDGPDNVNDFKENMEVPTALTYCQELHKSDGIFTERNVQKCLRKIENRIKRKKDLMDNKQAIKKMEKYLRIKQQYLEAKEKFLIKREYKLLTAEMKWKQVNLKKARINEKDKLGHLVESPDFKKLEEDKSEPEQNKYIDEKGFKYKESTKNGHPIKFKDGYTSKKEKRKEYFDKLKYKKTKIPDYNFNKNRKFKSTFKNRPLNEIPSSKEWSFDTDNTKNKDHSSKEVKSKEKKSKGSTNYIILDNNNNETISGYWVGKLYKGRNDMRNKKHDGDWYFDRASYRKNKRDKAKWYFDWMMDRELLRYKRTFYI